MTLWEKCVDFHGHHCGGLRIGYAAAEYAMKLLNIGFSDNEDVVCISENDACGVDAIQVMLGCSIGKGNLLFHMTGKQAFSFYHRPTGRSVRLVLIDAMPTRLALPTPAKIFDSYNCDCCGEKTGANWIRLAGGKKLCLDCYEGYDRFQV